MKTNIDTMLEKDQLELVIKGKSYFVRDIPLRTFLDAISLGEQGEQIGPEELRNQLASMLEIESKEIDKLGFRAMLFALTEIRKWITGQEASEGKNP